MLKTMFKTKKGVLYVTIAAMVLVLVVNISLGAYLQSRNQTNSTTSSHTVVATKEQAKLSKDTFVYSGVEGKNALQLLEQRAKSVGQNASGLVVSINGRKADERKKEFWAFYVNGKMAMVGPAEHVTKDGDKIEWKIETY